MQERQSPAAPRHAEGGFTLIEIMVVIVIIGLLATFVAPNVLGIGEDAKVTKAKVDVKQIADTAKIFKLNNNRLPSIEELTTPDEKGKTMLEILSKDPWDNDYVIREGERGSFEVISWGPDKAEGTEDDISSKPAPR